MGEAVVKYAKQHIGAIVVGIFVAGGVYAKVGYDMKTIKAMAEDHKKAIDELERSKAEMAVSLKGIETELKWITRAMGKPQP